MTIKNSYRHPKGMVQCRACEALRRKTKRHITGQSKGFNRPPTKPEAILQAALQAYRALGDAADLASLLPAYQALGEALGWPDRSRS